MAKTKAEIQRAYRQRSGGAADKKYHAANVHRVVLDLNINTDADVLAKLDSVPSKQGYVKDLIRADIAREGVTDT